MRVTTLIILALLAGCGSPPSSAPDLAAPPDLAAGPAADLSVAADLASPDLWIGPSGAVEFMLTCVDEPCAKKGDLHLLVSEACGDARLIVKHTFAGKTIGANETVSHKFAAVPIGAERCVFAYLDLDGDGKLSDGDGRSSRHSWMIEVKVGETTAVPFQLDVLAQ